MFCTDCKLAFQSKWGTFVPCYSYNQSIIKGLDMCLNSEYFEDGYINCPHFGCPDEGGCLFIVSFQHWVLDLSESQIYFLEHKGKRK